MHFNLNYGHDSLPYNSPSEVSMSDMFDKSVFLVSLSGASVQACLSHSYKLSVMQFTAFKVYSIKKIRDRNKTSFQTCMTNRYKCSLT